MHIGIKLRQLALWHGERPAIIDADGSWSFRAFHARLSRFGNALHGLGLQPGDRVALLIPDIREYLEVDYGTMAKVEVPQSVRAAIAELTGEAAR